MRGLIVALGMTLAGCSGGSKGSDEGSTDPASTDEAVTDDVGRESDTGTDPQALGPMSLSNPSFEAQGLDAAGGVFITSDQLSPTEIPGWTYVLGSYAGVGVSRASVEFAAVEPLAAPADGNHAGYLDGRGGGPGTNTNASLSYTLPRVINAGETVTATVAIGVRTGNTSVAAHSDVRVELATDAGVVLATTQVSLPSSGWVDASVAATFPADAAGERVAVFVRASQVGMPIPYYQTYVDNLRATVSLAEAGPVEVAVAVAR